MLRFEPGTANVNMGQEYYRPVPQARDPMPPVITPATHADFPAIVGLLERNALPRAGLEQQVTTMLVAKEGEQLVETAAAFFPKLGFRPIARSEVVQAVLESPEFTTACPASAVVMARSLR